MRLLMLLFYLVLIVLGVSFAALNASDVQVHFFITSFTLPVSVLIILVFGIGVLTGFTLFAFRYWRLKNDNRKLKQELKMTEKEVKNLRSIPLQNQH